MRRLLGGAMRVTGPMVVAALLAAAPAAAQATRPTVEYYQPFGAPTRPFSPAVRVGNLVFLAGQIGTAADASGPVVPGGVGPQTKQIMENIATVLKAIGLTMDDVVKCTVFMADMAEWDAMNAVYRTYFKPDRLPARSALGANGLALGARVEIECMAAAR